MSPFPGLLPPGAAAGGPPAQGNLQFWFKTPIGGLSNGNDVDPWPDSSGNGRDIELSDDGYDLPIYDTVNQIGGFDTVYFGGGSGFAARVLEWNGSLSWTTGSYCVVGEFDADPTSGGDDQNGIGINLNLVDSAQPTLFSDGHFYEGTLSTARKDTGDHTDSFANPHFYIIRSEDSSWKMDLNGTEVFTTGTNTFETAGTEVRIGMSRGGATSGAYKGRFAEILVWDKFLTDGEVTELHTYLTDKYGAIF